MAWQFVSSYGSGASSTRRHTSGLQVNDIVLNLSKKWIWAYIHLTNANIGVIWTWREIVFEYSFHMQKLGELLLELLSEALGLKPDHLKEMECTKGISLACYYYPPHVQSPISHLEPVSTLIQTSLQSFYNINQLVGCKFFITINGLCSSLSWLLGDQHRWSFPGTVNIQINKFTFEHIACANGLLTYWHMVFCIECLFWKTRDRISKPTHVRGRHRCLLSTFLTSLKWGCLWFICQYIHISIYQWIWLIFSSAISSL